MNVSFNYHFLKEIEMSKSAKQVVSTSTELTVEQQVEANRKKIVELNAKNRSLMKSAKTKAMNTVVDLLIKFELTIVEIEQKIAEVTMKKLKMESTPRKKPAPKYQNPANPSQTWVGSGKAPKWVNLLKELGTLESALIPLM